jgi:hypothetical protein
MTNQTYLANQALEQDAGQRAGHEGMCSLERHLSKNPALRADSGIVEQI